MHMKVGSPFRHRGDKGEAKPRLTHTRQVNGSRAVVLCGLSSKCQGIFGSSCAMHSIGRYIPCTYSPCVFTLATIPSIKGIILNRHCGNLASVGKYVCVELESFKSFYLIVNNNQKPSLNAGFAYATMPFPLPIFVLHPVYNNYPIYIMIRIRKASWLQDDPVV